MRAVPWRRALAGLAAVPLLLLPLLSRAAPDDEKPLGKLPPDLALVPRDAMMFVSVRASEVNGDERVKKLLALPGGRDALAVTERFFGLKPSDLERVTLVIRRVDTPPVVVLRTAKAFDKDALLKRFDRTDETSAHGKTIVVGHGFGPPVPIWFVDDRTFVQAFSREGLIGFLGVLAAGGKTHALADELKAADGKHTLVVAGRPELFFRMVDAERRRWEDRGPPRKDVRPKDKMPRDFKDKDAPPPPGEVPKDTPRPPTVKDKAAFLTSVRVQREKDVVKDGGRPGGAADDGKEVPPKLRTMEEIDSDPDPFRMGEMTLMKPVFRAKRALLTADLGETIVVNARAEFGSEDDVKDGETVVRMGLYLLREMFPHAMRRELGLDFTAKPMAALLKQYKDAIRGVELKSDGKSLVGTAKLKLDLAPLFKHVADEAPARADANNLKQIALAFHNYHATHNHIIRAICDRDGKPLLSWRVAILPYIEEQRLYMQFKLDEPWDSPHNKKLLAKMPKLYAPVVSSGADPDMTTTFYQVFSGPNTLFPKPDSRAMFHRIPDGTSNTILVAESARAVPWSKPEDIEVDAKTIPKLGGQFERFLHIAWADGSVRRIKRGLPDAILRPFIEPADGMVVDHDKLKP